MTIFSRSSNNELYELALRESAQRLHKRLPELDPLIFEAFLTIGRTWEVLQKMGDKGLANMGLTPYQRHTIRFLLTAPDNRLTIGDLASELQTTSVNVTKLANRMERAGMVRREPDTNDKRVIWVALTPAGRERYMAAIPISHLDREAFSVLSEKEQRTLISLLSRVREKAVQLSEDIESTRKDQGEPSSRTTGT
jgi:DNA-binding MarR family transcriptional regulator